MLKGPDSMIRVAAESQVLEVTKWAFVYAPENYTSDRETILAYFNRLDIGLETIQHPYRRSPQQRRLGMLSKCLKARTA